MIIVSEKNADENQNYFTQRIRDHRSIKCLKGVYISFRHAYKIKTPTIKIIITIIFGLFNYILSKIEL